MSSDPPPPYPGGPSAPLIEEKDGSPFPAGQVPPSALQPPPLDVGPPPYEATPPQPGFLPPTPLPSTEGPMHAYVAPPGGYYVHPGPHPPMGYYPGPGGPYAPMGGPGAGPAAVLMPSVAATTVTVLQGEVFQAAPVPTVCPHCQQAITTKVSHEVGLMNFLLGFFCCFVGCDLGCCLIPCLIDEFKDVTHTCPNCKAYIYTYKRMC